MSISLVGTATASATTVTPPAHQAGDLILIWAMRGASTAFPSVPAGYLPIVQKSNATATSLCAIAGYKIASSTSDASGTWTNASELVCAVYRPSAGSTLRIGEGNTSSATTSTVAFPTLSPMGDSGSGNSWIVGLVAASNTTQTLTAVPTGMTNQASVVGASYQAALHDTEGGVSSWASANANVVGAGNTVSATVEIVLAPTTTAAVPNVYHHMGGGGLQATRALSGNGFKCPLLNPSGTGNSILIGFTCTGGATVSSVSGSVNGAYTQVNTALGGAGNLDSYVYLLQNCANGTETITVTFNATVGTFQYVITEFYGVATGGGNNGTSKNAYSATLGAPSFTPTNNNANGGNIIWVYSCKAETDPNQFVSGLYPVAPFNFLTADTADSGTSPQINIPANSPANSLPKVAMAYLQAISAAIAPTFVSVNEPAQDNWNTIAVALPLSPGAGSVPTSGIFIHGIQHYSSTYFPTSGMWGMQVCATGNLRMIQSDDPSLNALTVTDSEGNTWIADGAGIGAWYLANTQVNPNLTVFINGGGGDNELSWRFFDISGADPSPFVGALANAQDVHGLTSYTCSPSPAPTNDSGLIIAAIGVGDGPGLAVTAPATAVWDFCTYTGELDTDTIENADILAHFYYTTAGSQTWTFSITSRATNSTSGGFIWFRTARAAVITPHLAPMRGVPGRLDFKRFPPQALWGYGTTAPVDILISQIIF
jgi:hypothetical protein